MTYANRLACLLVAALILTPSVCLSGTADRVLFLHHSTGAGVWGYPDKGVPAWFGEYNTANATSFDVTERSYPTGSYPWDNYPYDYWNLWINGMCNSNESSIECMNTLAADHEIIIFKHCFPGADVGPDVGADITSSYKSLENYKLQYRALRTMMDAYPDTKFIVWTLAPLHRLATDAAHAARAAEFVAWVKGDFLTEDGGPHPNIFVFDFWSIVAETDPAPAQGTTNCLKYEYEGSHTDSDSHPNGAANNVAGPLFAQFIVDTALAETAPSALPPGVLMLLLD